MAATLFRTNTLTGEREEISYEEHKKLKADLEKEKALAASAAGSAYMANHHKRVQARPTRLASFGIPSVRQVLESA